MIWSADSGSIAITQTHIALQQKYHVDKLVYYETTTDIRAALEREKQLKSWNRRKKNELIQRMNPMWHDLSPQSSDKE